MKQINQVGNSQYSGFWHQNSAIIDLLQIAQTLLFDVYSSSFFHQFLWLQMTDKKQKKKKSDWSKRQSKFCVVCKKSSIVQNKDAWLITPSKSTFSFQVITKKNFKLVICLWSVIVISDNSLSIFTSNNFDDRGDTNTITLT